MELRKDPGDESLFLQTRNGGQGEPAGTLAWFQCQREIDVPGVGHRERLLCLGKDKAWWAVSQALRENFSFLFSLSLSGATSPSTLRIFACVCFPALLDCQIPEAEHLVLIRRCILHGSSLVPGAKLVLGH